MLEGTTTYESVARDIISKSISTAVFIDDRALETFKSKNYSPRFIDDHNLSIGLYRDFKSKNCLLHSFKFTKSGWRKNKEFCIKNRDLLILDWQLVGQDHREALKILDYSVKEKSLHFACIYTRASQDSVKNELNKFYWGKVSSEINTTIRESLDGTELSDIWLLDINDGDWLLLDELLNNVVNANENELTSEIESFRNAYNLEQESIEIFKSIHSNERVAFSKLKTILTNDNQQPSFSSLSSSSRYSISQQDQYTFYVNHTIVKILRKSELDGNQLYDAFFNSILSDEQNIFLTLMGLEMRNRFRDSSAFIGKDFDGLSEDAFFYHKNKNNSNPEIFTEFLRELMKDQVSSFIYEDNLLLFDVLEEYYDSIDGSKRQADFTHMNNKQSFLRELFQLNYFYNRINLNERKSNDTLRFGDILSYTYEEEVDGENVEKKKYFACITALCDCLRPEDKIKNQFWFIEGRKELSQESVLKKTDGKFISFIKEGGEVIAVDWKNGKSFCQPFTIQIQNSLFDNNRCLQGQYFDNGIDLKLVCSLKDNYAQRLANEASSYPIRVGIDFVKKS